MADDIEEGIEDLPDAALTEELKGTVVEVEDRTKTALWAVISLVTLLLVIAVSWTTLFLTRTNDEILQEQLSSQMAVRKMVYDAHRVVQASFVTADELCNAISSAIDAATTEARIAGTLPFDLIKERSEAILVSLEGILRLELEILPISEDPLLRVFIDDELNRLGEQYLEYYDNGILERFPLLEAAFLRKLIREEENRSQDANTAELQDLRDRLRRVNQEHSFSVVGAAYTLGRWYRFHNDKEMASRCFQLGRRYVDGYLNSSTTIEGIKPKVLSPLWDSYVGCLEALAEMSFREGAFRQARLYLTRIFHTPNSLQHILKREKATITTSASHSSDNDAFQHDIALLTKAIANPLDLPSFPLFQPGEEVFNWNASDAFLAEAPLAPKNDPKYLVWQALPKDGLDVKETIVHTLNALIEDPDFHNYVAFDAKNLSFRGQQLAQARDQRFLVDEESQFLNREILESALTDLIKTQHVLSDGSRLTNQLSSTQERLLQELQADASTAQTETISTLHDELDKQTEYYQEQQLKAERTSSEQKEALLAIHQEIRALESVDGIAIEQLQSYKRQEELALKRQQLSQNAFADAESQLKELEAAREVLTLPLRQKLASIRQQQKEHENQQKQLIDVHLADGNTLLKQIDNQIRLRKKYQELLEDLQHTEGSKELERIRIEKQRLEAELAVIEEQISPLTGDAREIAEFERAELKNQLHHLIQAFDELFNPIRHVVKKIVAQEEEIWQAEQLLKQTRKEILSLIGSEGHPESLQEKSRQRAALLLMKSDNVLNSGLYDAEIRKLNADISQDHARLHTLLQTELSARQTLHTFHPGVASSHPLIHDNGELAPLAHHMKVQSDLMENYETLWLQNELLEAIHTQESILLTNLQLIADNLAAHQQLSESQTRELTRYMENILHARNMLRDRKTALHQLLKERQTDGSINEIAGSGYLLDSVDMFQMEHNLGLHLNEYRKAFDDRQALVTDMQQAMQDKQLLEDEKLLAARNRNQNHIDELIPLAAEKEGIVILLSQKVLVINERLRQLGEVYSEGLSRVQVYRKKLIPEIDQAALRMDDLTQQMVRNDEKLAEMRSQLFQEAFEVSRSVTSLTLNDLEGIDEIIAYQKQEIERLQQIQSLQQRENYYKAKALWLIGNSFHAESQLEDRSALVAAQHLDLDVWREVQSKHHSLYPEFDAQSLETDPILLHAPSSDENQAEYETWISNIENTALQIFQRDLPAYLLEWDSEAMRLLTKEQEDQKVFIARSQFMVGEIYMKRALRLIRTSRLSPKDNIPARKVLNMATTVFLSFLDFAEPLVYSDQGLTETTIGSQEFPQRKRRAVNQIDEARIFLGIIATLKGSYHEAISYYRELLTLYAMQMPKNEKEILGQVDPVLLDNVSEQYHPQMYPVYTSLLAYKPTAHEALYRLARNYQALADEHHRLELENSALPFTSTENDQNLARLYGGRAIAYYTQLIQTQSYSPFRRAALLQRALLWKRVEAYSEARNDLVAILGSPENQGDSWSMSNMTNKGDLPGELNPGYSYVAFELGKLHLENRNYVAAADAFFRSKESDHNNIVVLQAKIAYAETLIATKNWLMADLFLSELVQERASVPDHLEKYYHLDILVDLVKVKTRLGNLTAALQIIKKIFQNIPAELVQEGYLLLDNAHGLRLLETDMRDAIRPLALACLEEGRILRIQRDYSTAKKSFLNAKKLFHMMPWREDRLMREVRKQEFFAYQEQQTLLCRWEILKTDAVELLYSSLAGLRQEYEVAARKENAFSLDKIKDSIESALQGVEDNKEHFHHIVKALANFHEEEFKRLPDEVERQRIVQERELERQTGSPEFLRYDTLLRIRHAILSITNQQTESFAHLIAKHFSKESFEDSILNQFVLDYSQKLALTNEDRQHMAPSRTNFENLLAIPNAQQRLADLDKALLRWVEEEMLATGLDDLFIPVTPQSQILEEVDLYLVSLLAHLDDRKSYKELTDLVDSYIEKLNKTPNRLTSPQRVWQMVELAAMTTKSQLDWERSYSYNTFLLKPDNLQFFFAEDESDRHRTQLDLATALVHLSQKTLGNLIFLLTAEEKQQQQQDAEQQLDRARVLLEQLSATPGQTAENTMIRIRAKQILSEVGV